MVIAFELFSGAQHEAHVLESLGVEGTRSTAVAPTCRDVWPGARMAAPGPCPHNMSRAVVDESPHAGGSRH